MTNVNDQTNIINNIAAGMGQLQNAIQMATTTETESAPSKIHKNTSVEFQEPKRHAKPTLQQPQSDRIESFSDKNMYAVLEHANEIGNPEPHATLQNGEHTHPQIKTPVPESK